MTDIHKVRGPNFRSETPVYYYEYMPLFAEKHFGGKPSRSTLGNWSRDGYPIAKGGPYVEVPIKVVLKRPMTTKEAMGRFLTSVRECEKHYV